MTKKLETVVNTGNYGYDICKTRTAQANKRAGYDINRIASEILQHETIRNLIRNKVLTYKKVGEALILLTIHPSDELNSLVRTTYASRNACVVRLASNIIKAKCNNRGCMQAWGYVNDAVFKKYSIDKRTISKKYQCYIEIFAGCTSYDWFRAEMNTYNAELTVKEKIEKYSK